MLLQILTLIGALGMFLYGMNQMSSGLQKAAGDKMRSFLGAMTSNPFKRVMTGLGITSIIQSSSATTVMVVSFVNAGLLTLVQAVGVIMGANIGTTVTAWLIAWLGFKADISLFAVPLMAAGFLLSISSKERRKNIGELIVGFSLLFLGLSLMKESVPDLNQTPEVLEFIRQWTDYGFWSVLIFLVFGTLLTLVLQSSSATMALTLIMVNLQWIPFEMAAAMVLGENIGTTITANIAASVGNTAAKRAAMAHTVFNVFGVIWAVILFHPFLALVGRIIELFGLPDPNMADAGGTSTLYGISMLHTLFNVFNTIILIGFTKQIVKLVSKIVKEKKNKEEDEYRLQYIEAGPIATAEIATEAAIKETIHFAEISRKGLGYAIKAIQAGKSEEFEKYRKKLVQYEEISDRIEQEIANYLNAIPAAEISECTRGRIKALYRIIGELESLGDSGESISRILSRKNNHNQRFEASALNKLHEMADLVDQCYEVMLCNLRKAEEGTLTEISNAYSIEEKINNTRNFLRDEVILALESKQSDYHSTVYFMDVISEFEKMGDYMINISQDLIMEKA